jgi:hypothetical protein
LAGAAPSQRSPRFYTPKHLAERIPAEQAAMESRGAQEGERKTITALFADIKGLVEMMEGSTPRRLAPSSIRPTRGSAMVAPGS